MQLRIIVPIFASLALCATAALAQDAPPGPQAPGTHRVMRMEFDSQNMAQRRANFCADRYARAVGAMSYLETRLALSDRQRPLFDRWKRDRLESAKAHDGECATVQLPGPQGSAVDKMKLRERMLKERLDDLQGQMPSFEALYASLSDEQKHVLDGFHRGGMQGRMGGWHENNRRTIIMRRDGGGPDGNPQQGQ